MKKKIIATVLVLMVLPCIALAQPNLDLRFKLGNAAGADELEIYPDTTNGSGNGGGSFQIDLVLTPIPNASVSPLFSFGLFSRKHSGNISDLYRELPIDYDAAGGTLGVGASIRANERLRIEPKVEFGFGSGKLDSGTTWNDTENGGYGSVSFLVGIYYTFSSPGLQLGAEVGAQSFSGDFQIWESTYGEWVDGTVRGSGGIVNFVLGFQF